MVARVSRVLASPGVARASVGHQPFEVGSRGSNQKVTNRNFLHRQRLAAPKARRRGREKMASLCDEIKRGGHGKGGGFVLVR